MQELWGKSPEKDTRSLLSHRLLTDITVDKLILSSIRIIPHGASGGHWAALFATLMFMSDISTCGMYGYYSAEEDFRSDEATSIPIPGLQTQALPTSITVDLQHFHVPGQVP